MRKVFLDDLPRRNGRGVNKDKECIDWKNSIGHRVRFIYQIKKYNIEDEITIIDYITKKQKSFIIVYYNNKIYSLVIDGFKKCKLGIILGFIKEGYKYNIGDIIKTKTGEIEILEQITMEYGKYKNYKAYKYKCLIDGNIDNSLESNISKGVGCNVCHNLKVLKGCNDLWTTRPDIAKLLKYPNNGYSITHSTGKSEMFLCPNCGYQREYKLYTISAYYFSCPRCSDNNSYPNKFAFNLLEQLNIYFEYEYSPDWIKPRRYDFYFELNNKKYIFEMDGGWHKKDNNLSGLTAKEAKEIDDYKDKMAEINGIEVIRINCDKSKLEYIKNNILHSKLNKLFDLSSINWLKCHEFACSTRIIEASNYYNEGKNIKDISIIMKLSYGTICNYLNKAHELKWCIYDTKQIMIDNGKINGKKLSIPVIQLSLTGEYIAEFESATEAGRQLNLNQSNISECCRRETNHAYGFIWMFKNYYDDNKDIISFDNIQIHTKRKVIQLSLNGEYIKEYESISEAENIIGCIHITDCCKGERKSSGGFMWKYKEDYDESINYNKYIRLRNNINIIQLTLDNVFIKEFESAVEAEKETKVSRSSICNCCKGSRKHAGNYRWFYKNDYEQNIDKLTPIFLKERNIIQLDLNYNLIKEYNNMKEAEIETNIFISNISSCYRGKIKTAGGFKWIFKKDYKMYIEKQNNIA